MGNMFTFGFLKIGLVNFRMCARKKEREEEEEGGSEVMREKFLKSFQVA